MKGRSLLGSAFKHYALQHGSSSPIRLSNKDIPFNMRAILQTGYGAAEKSLGFAKLQTPMVSPYDVLVRVKAASINQIDAKLRWGYGKAILELPPTKNSRLPQKAPPFIIGRDFSGEIVQVGSAVPETPLFQLNKPVFGLVNQLSAQGSWSEYVKVPYWCVAEKPDYLSFEEAASLPFSLSGALELLNAYGNANNILPEEILISGGGTGGSVAYYLALLFISQGIQPCSLFHSEPKALHDIRVFDTAAFDMDTFVRKCATSTAVFLPNALQSMTNVLNTADDARLEYLLTKKQEAVYDEDEDEDEEDSDEFTKNNSCQVFHLCSSGIDIMELLQKEPNFDYTINPELPYSLKINFLQAAYSDPVMMVVNFQRVDTAELDLYPSLRPQRQYHVGLRRIVDELHDYITRWTKRPNPACVYKTFPFSMAKDAHQMYDDGECSGKIVISMEELWNNDDKRVLYQKYEVPSFTVPSSTLYPLLSDYRAHNK